MGEFRFRNLERFQVGRVGDNLQLALPLPRTAKGLVYRHCPNEKCSPRLFLLGDPPENQTINADHISFVRRSPGTPGTTCPYCGMDADDQEFLFQGDIDAATEQVHWAAMQDVSEALDDMFGDLARDINRSGGKFMSARYTRGTREPRPFVCREDLLRSLICATCQRHYGVYAIGLFCPDCGSRNLSVHFQREVDLVQRQIALATSADDEELSYRLLGNAHEDVLTALETYLKTVFRFAVAKRFQERYDELCSAKAIGNVFQNIDRGRKEFAFLSIDPYAGLSDEEIAVLRLNIEKRHVVGHNLGIADEKYLRADENVQEGQTVRILADDISRFTEIGAKVIATIEELPDFLPSTFSDIG